MQHQSRASARREFLQTMGGGVLGLTLAGKGWTAATKPMRGVFPIGQTPVTETDKLDLECLQNEVRFCNRFKVHGFAWPQIASGWTALSEKERLDGAEAILAAGKGGKRRRSELRSDWQAEARPTRHPAQTGYLCPAAEPRIVKWLLLPPVRPRSRACRTRGWERAQLRRFLNLEKNHRKME